MTVESKSLSRQYKDVGLETLGKRTRRPPINHDINFPPKKKSKHSDSRKSPAKKATRGPKKPNRKGGYDLCESDDDDDGLLTGSEESSEIETYREKSKKKKNTPKSKKANKKKKEISSSEDSEDASLSGSDQSAEGEENKDSEESEETSNSTENDSDSKKKSKTTKTKNSKAVKKDEETDDETSNENSSSEDEDEVLVELSSSEDEDEVKDGIDQILGYKKEGDVEKYLIKWKNLSHWHLTWETKDEVEEIPGGKARIKNYRIDEEEDDEDNIDGNHSTIDRIISKKGNRYLCKWKTLGYDQSTWEKEQDIISHEFKEKIDEFVIRGKFPSKSKLNAFKRPPAKEFNPDKVVLPTFKGDRELHDYQVDGVKWLICCWYARRSSILADEMGLGKTIQSAAILEYLYSEKGNLGPFLVIAPVSTLEQWRRELENWTHLNVVMYHGTTESREMIRQYEWKYDNYKKEKVYKFNVLITSYQLLSSDIDHLSCISWQYMIIDEGHRLKNTKSKLFEALTEFKTQHKLILTGTPLQNNISELWAILTFIDGDRFDDCEEFEREFKNLEDARKRKRLHKLLSAYLLRRLKEDVFKSIPAKEETIIETELTTIQKKFYKAILDRNREFLCRGVKKSAAASLINIMMELRKCCNHAFLISGAEEKILAEAKGEDENTKFLSTLVNSSSKMVVLDKLLSKLRAEGHQVLVFSQMTKMLNILEDFLEAKGYPYERLDGSVGLTQRQAAIDRFSNKENDNFVFLLSTRAGGLGLNLTAANTVIIFDSDWNPQNDLQAQARCHRIGQTDNVKIYRLVTKNTYEEYMLSVASKKLGLEMVVFSGDEENPLGANASKKLDVKEINHLLRYGAYQLFNTNEEDEKELENKLLTEDINAILDRATIIKYEENANLDENKSKQLIAGLSKVTYQIDLEDDEFWEKVLPEHKSAKQLIEQLKNEESLKTEEEKKVFLEDVKAIVGDIKEASGHRSKSFLFTSHSHILQACKLIDQIIHNEKFINHREFLFNLRNSIANDRRERKMIDRSLPQYNPGSTATTTTTAKRNSTKKKEEDHEPEKKEKEFEWTKSIRDKIKVALSCLGVGRWQEIFDQTFQGAKKTAKVDQIRSLCECMIQQYFGKENIGTKLVFQKDNAETSPKTKDEPKTKKNLQSFYGKYIEKLSETVNEEILDLAKYPKNFTSQQRSDWSNVEIQLNCHRDREFYAGQYISVTLNKLPSPPEDTTGPQLPVFIVIKFLKDDKQEGNNSVLMFQKITDFKEKNYEFQTPGFVGEYQMQLWSPMWTKQPTANPTKQKIPHIDFTVGCPDILDNVTLLSTNRWQMQCEMMKSIDKLIKDGEKNLKKPTKVAPPVWWWNLLRDDDYEMMKALHKHGYGHYSAIRSDKTLPYHDDTLSESLKPIWEKKTSDEKFALGYATGNESDKNAKKKLKSDPYEFPSTPALNKRLKQLVKANEEGSEVDDMVIPVKFQKAPSKVKKQLSVKTSPTPKNTIKEKLSKGKTTKTTTPKVAKKLDSSATKENKNPIKKSSPEKEKKTSPAKSKETKKQTNLQITKGKNMTVVVPKAKKVSK